MFLSQGQSQSLGQGSDGLSLYGLSLYGLRCTGFAVQAIAVPLRHKAFVQFCACSLLSIQNQWQLKDAATFFDALVVLMEWFNGGVRQLIGAMLHGKNVLLASMRRTARTIFIAGDVALTIQDT